LPLWAALLAEPWRLRGGPARASTAWRCHSYQARSRYRSQLAALYDHFPSEQVLVLANDALARTPAETVQRVLRFLGVTDTLPVDAVWPRVFQGDYAPPPAWSPARIWLALSLRAERRAWRGLCSPPDQSG